MDSKLPPARDRKSSIERMEELGEHPLTNELVMALWLLSGVSLIVSLWVLITDMGGIYLRATLFIYLAMTGGKARTYVRSVRVSVACIIIILAASTVSYEVDNIPLFLAAGLALLHIMMCIISFPPGPVRRVTGARGMVFVVLALGVSGLATTVALVADLPSYTVAQAVVFILVGAPLLTLANGIPAKESDQTLGAFSVLGSGVAAMYSMNDLTAAGPWLILAGCMAAGVAASMCCVTVGTSWGSAVVLMVRFALSARVSALLLLITFTFGAIACMNGDVVPTEAVICSYGPSNATLSPAAALLRLNAINNSAHSTLIDPMLQRITKDLLVMAANERTGSCLKAGSDFPDSREPSELIGMLNLGLAKGAVLVIVVLTLKRDLDEKNAWAIATCLSLAGVLWLGVEYRGMCFIADSKDCDPFRSDGYIAGLVIIGASSFLCAVRSIYVGYCVRDRKIKQHARAVKGEGQATLCGDLMNSYKKRGTRRDTIYAVALSALLICFIAASSTSVEVVGNAMDIAPPTGLVANDCLGNADASSLITTYNLTVPVGILNAALNSACSSPLSELPSFPGNVLFQALLNETVGERPSGIRAILEARADTVEVYWQRTAWIVAASIFLLTLVAIETLPAAPAVGVALMTALLVAGARIHYALVMSNLNYRAAGTGMQLRYTTNLNVYIMGLISAVVGLAWAVATVTHSRKEAEKTQDEAEGVKYLALVLQVSDDDEQQMMYDALSILASAVPLAEMEQAGIIRNTSKSGDVVTVYNYVWALEGRSELNCGCYKIRRDMADFEIVARAVQEGRGTLIEREPDADCECLKRYEYD